MLRKWLLFVSVNILFIALALGIYAAGYEYDNTNKLHPEMKDFSIDVTKQVYGQRWERAAKIMLGVGVAIDAVVLLGWLRKREGDERHRIDTTTTL